MLLMLQNGREKKEIIPNHVSFVYKALNAVIQRGLKLGWIAQALRANSRPERKRGGSVKRGGAPKVWLIYMVLNSTVVYFILCDRHFQTRYSFINQSKPEHGNVGLVLSCLS